VEDITTNGDGFSIMYETELWAVATGAAGTLVAAIATYGAERVRLKVTRFFRHATPDQQRVAAQAVDDTAAQLASPAPDTQDLAVSMWARLISQYLAEHRDAMGEVDELVMPAPTGPKTWNQHNNGAGTFIGGDVYGGVTFNYGGASDGGN
jgi:hypothetical protein